MVQDTSGVAVVLCVLIGGMGTIIAAGVAVMVMMIRRRGGPTKE